MKISIRPAHCALIATLLVTPALFAQSTTAKERPIPRPAAKQELPDVDRNFLREAVRAGHKEVAVSQAVRPHLTSKAVRNFSEMMIREHKAANEELLELARKRGQVLPPMDDHVAADWSTKGRGADALYIDEMVDDHREAVAIFEAGLRSRDPEIAEFAARTLKKIRNHFEEARRFQQENIDRTRR